jgi:hypothetical protein
MDREESKEKLKSAWAFMSTPRAKRLGAGFAGRAAALAMGWFCMTVGVVLTFTLCGAVIGVPLLAFGFLLMARGLF